MPDSNLASLQLIKASLLKQYRPTNIFEERLTIEMARELWSLEQMGEINFERLTRLCSLEPEPLALAKRLNFPWPEHAIRLQEAFEPYALRARLIRALNSLANDLNQPPLKGSHSAASKLIQQSIQILQSDDPLKLMDSKPLWHRLDDFLNRMQAKLVKESPVSSNNLIELTTPRDRLLGLHKPHAISPTASDVIPKYELPRPEPRMLQVAHAQPASIAPEPNVLENTLILYWIFRRRDTIQSEHALMMAERRSEILNDPGAMRAQSSRLRKIAQLGELILKSQIDTKN